ncbi:MAG: AgmX/PglI C-terminal domain-containing protein [Myxococcales bacterium]|nr:AgmX/PglI C-terminal domain-containing protein [Myxococcales bacterium]
MSGQPAVLQVVILRDGLLVGTEVFVPGSYAVGSGPQCELKLDDASVSASHATLYFQNGKAAIQDAGGQGGVFVNGHKVSACEVRSMDEVVIGPFVMKVRVLAQKPQGKVAPPPEVAALLQGTPLPTKAPLAGRSPPGHGKMVTPQGADATVPMARPATPPPPPNNPQTMLSARRIAAAPQPAQGPAPAKAPHLRAVPKPISDDEQLTENFDVPTELAPATVASSHRKSRRPQPAAERRPHRKPSPPPVQAGELGKGRSKLFLELYWGEVRREARSYGSLTEKRPLIGAHDEHAPFPLWGFTLPASPFTLAETSAADAYRVFVPRSAVAERRHKDGNFYPVAPEELESEGGRRFLTLSKGMAARLSEGEMSLVAYVQPPQRQPFVNPLQGLPWLAITILLVTSAGFGAFLYYGPQPVETADFQQRNLPPVAVRLIAPEKKKKEEAKKKLEELKEKAKKAEKKKEKEKAVVEKLPPKKEKEVPPPPAESKALKALAKLTAAGPASKDILAAVDKLGNGPGSKFAKESNYKLSGLIGKAPIANAGLGTFGLGGGGGGGFGTKGAEILRGRGGGGIGALGAGSIGRGAVGGVVTRASARSVAVQGSIDREAVARVVNAHLQEVRACYERALLKDPGLAGKVVLEWTISTGGKVVTAKTKSSTLKNSAVEGCILQNLKGWTFPPAKGGIVIVSYPFLFNSVGY